ncbi:poly [ADP-ribose] polymerase 12-like [Solea senegalensis]|uniref:Poly [ADP-ribose] polymerase 12-like n=1 Tax=Solea senegalensis TaxID=28829 RepID=A0AAV6QW30_SOLSE|nr:poly [ADP-ribose] polymerase 12-like [Solea senegalensis]
MEETEILKFICANQGAVNTDELLYNVCCSDSTDTLSNRDKFALCCLNGQPKVVARTRLRLCRKKDCPWSCGGLHLCVNFLYSGCCSRRVCSFCHELNSAYNEGILKQHELESLSRTELCTLLLQSDYTLLPHICHDYNNKGDGEFGRCKDGNDCKRLHICERYLNSDCHCFRVHAFHAPQPLKVLQSKGFPDTLMSSLKTIYINKEAIQNSDKASGDHSNTRSHKRRNPRSSNSDASAADDCMSDASSDGGLNLPQTEWYGRRGGPLGTRGNRGNLQQRSSSPSDILTCIDDLDLYTEDGLGEDASQHQETNSTTSDPADDSNNDSSSDSDQKRNRQQYQDKAARGRGGHQGNRGSTGNRGYVGNRGNRGYSGSRGNRGYVGNRGNRGYSGERGNRGYVGNRGNRGYSGERGNRGYRGDGGVRGYSGDRGNRGYSGERGNRGYSGDGGVRGYSGERGNRGYSVERGNRGYSVERGNSSYSVDEVNSGYSGDGGFRGNSGNRGNTGNYSNLTQRARSTSDILASIGTLHPCTEDDNDSCSDNGEMRGEQWNLTETARGRRRQRPVREKTEICLFFIKGRCIHDDDKCYKVHDKMPYRWEVREGDQWTALPDNEEIERDYCDPKKSQSCSTPPVHFDTMTCGQNNVRRLSTPNSLVEPTFMYTTEWIWHWEDGSGIWNMYSSPGSGHDTADIDSTKLEQKFLINDKDVVEFTTGSQSYSLSFQEMIQTNKHYGTKRLVRRRPQFVSVADVLTKSVRRPKSQPTFCHTPGHWDKTQLPETGYRRVSLESSSDEFKEIESLFCKTMKGFDIVSIERIQNISLWEVFQWQKNQMKKANDGQNVKERKLFHGTDSEHIDAICLTNFDWRICGTHGTAYGRGSYFARDAKYSHSYTSNSAVKSMFISRVLVGDYTRGSSDYTRAPSKDDGNVNLYNSCVDNVISPSIFVVFKEHQIYPEYLLHCSGF